jgi:hypothetical protein
LSFSATKPIAAAIERDRKKMSMNFWGVVILNNLIKKLATKLN